MNSPSPTPLNDQIPLNVIEVLKFFVDAPWVGIMLFFIKYYMWLPH